MHGGHFDRLTTTFAMAGSRRGLLQGLAALPLGGMLAMRLGIPVAAKRRPRKGVHPEVVGGHPVPQGTFPFLVYYENLVSACGGSVIAPGYVLTAAHCTGPDAGHDPPFPPQDYYVGIGQINLDRLGPANSFGVVAVHRHPSWDPDTSQAFDVAVLELDRPVPPSLTPPVAFVGADDTRFDGAGQPVVVAGWGSTSTGGPTSTILLQADLDIVSDAQCAADWGAEFEAENMVCAAFPGRDSCQGDSGGPLFANQITGYRKVYIKKKRKKGKKRKKWKKKRVPVYTQTQMGIVSFGAACADPLFPGIYARLSDPDIADFISDVLAG